jgi:hypothetical protein
LCTIKLALGANRIRSAAVGPLATTRVAKSDGKRRQHKGKQQDEPEATHCAKSAGGAFARLRAEDGLVLHLRRYQQ